MFGLRWPLAVSWCELMWKNLRLIWRNGSISGGAGVARSGASLRRRRRASVCARRVVVRRRCGVDSGGGLRWL